MRRSILITLSVALLGSACDKSSDGRQYALQGQVIAITPGRQEATIKHEEIKGLMPAMTMPYKVKEAKLLDSVVPGDLVKATLVIVSNDAYLTTLSKIGHAPVAKPPVDAPPSSASSGFELLKVGEAVPDASFVDQDGVTQRFSSFKGSTVLLTFIYTTCPMPTFCPLMDRHFASIQKALQKEPALKGGVHLVSVSFDPATDTPAVLRQHAKSIGADLRSWTFLTGGRDEVDKFAAQFGVLVERALTDQRDITHTLRTAIIDPQGRLAKIYIGNEWTPAQILGDLKAGARTN